MNHRESRVEGKIGQGKRRYSLGLVMTKLASTSESSIMIAFIVMNLKRWLAILFFILKISNRDRNIQGIRTYIRFVACFTRSAISKINLEQMSTSKRHAF